MIKKFLSIAYLLLLPGILFAQYKKTVDQTTGSASQYSKFNINKISTFINNNGLCDHDINGNSGFVYPKVFKKGDNYYRPAIFFYSGFVWGGKVDGEIRTGGSTYWSGLKPGKILESGLAEDPISVNVRVFRVRRDYKTADLSMEANDENKSVQEIFNQYEKDWNEWRAVDGAPYEDLDGNGKYNPAIDIPGIPGADQTLWFVANDLDSNQTKALYGSLPMGIEMQTTVWGYSAPSPFNSMVFKRYVLINKSNRNFSDMYIGIWSDADLGDAGDDLVGCDTVLNLGYIYNSKPVDNTYNPYPPPSGGFCLLQGPLVDSPNGAEGFSFGKTIKGKKNLKMTGFSWIYKNYGIYGWHDPNSGNYDRGTLYLYNLLQGLLGNGLEHPLPKSMGPGTTKFPFSGDPVTQNGFVDGWVEFNNGITTNPFDKRLMVCSGAFNLAAGDSQEVVFAQLAAGADNNIDYLSAVSLLKLYSAAARTSFPIQNIPIANSETTELQSVELDRKIVLYWGEDQQKLDRIEKGNYVYKFQGYNIYQIPLYNSTLQNGRLIATYDVVDGVGKIWDYEIDTESQTIVRRLKQFGNDYGVKRYIEIEKDNLKNLLLNNGTPYYFAVTHYSYYNPFIYPTSYESPPVIVKAIPQSNPPGIRYSNNFGDEILIKHVAGNSKAEVIAMVIDPSKLTTSDYEVQFTIVDDKITFSLLNLTTNNYLLRERTNLTGDDDYFITEGFLLKVKDVTSGPLTEKDFFQFSTQGPVFNQNLAKADIEKINVFPNPYYATNPNEINKYERIVTINHLPERATIRIFNLAGQLIRTLEKNSPEQFMRWDLLNESRFLAPSGLYIIHIEMLELGKTKILKLAIVQELVIPDWF